MTCGCGVVWKSRICPNLVSCACCVCFASQASAWPGLWTREVRGTLPVRLNTRRSVVRGEPLETLGGGALIAPPLVMCVSIVCGLTASLSYRLFSSLPGI